MTADLAGVRLRSNQKRWHDMSIGARLLAVLAKVAAGATDNNDKRARAWIMPGIERPTIVDLTLHLSWPDLIISLQPLVACSEVSGEILVIPDQSPE
jgi:hypothetical protein